MRSFALLAHYFWWHYTGAIEDLVANYLNLAGFLRDFFSLNHLTKNLFTPWRRLGEGYPDHFDLEAYATAFIVNTLMRLVGFCIRLVVILLGLVLLVASLIVFFVVLLLWLILPIAVLFLLALGAKLIFS